MGTAPGKILMSIQYDVFIAIFFAEEFVPISIVELESVMENELEPRLLLFHHLLHISIKLGQDCHV